jgi:cytochrome c biogenesis protein CcmG/thiol:disulfide interchange protein DsbE
VTDTVPVESGRRSRWPWVIAGVCGVVVAALIGVLATSPVQGDRAVGSPLVGSLVPSIEASDTTGETFDIDQYRGSWVLLNFFATWCGPCVTEHPELVAFSERHANGNAYVVSVAFNEEPEKVDEFFEDNGGDWPVIAEGNGRFALEYGVVKLPESYLIAPDGVVVAKFEGGVTVPEIEGVIAEMATDSVGGETQ